LYSSLPSAFYLLVLQSLQDAHEQGTPQLDGHPHCFITAVISALHWVSQALAEVMEPKQLIKLVRREAHVSVYRFCAQVSAELHFSSVNGLMYCVAHWLFAQFEMSPVQAEETARILSLVAPKFESSSPHAT
jgi:hypothetical protein